MSKQTSQNQPPPSHPKWQTKPEIDGQRQSYLTNLRKSKANFDQSAYPFKDIELSRADVEWLLLTHENGRGPVDWNDESQREREGLDLRGANLRGVDLSHLPLTRLRASLSQGKWREATAEQKEAAAVHLEGANLFEMSLEDADLRGAHLEGGRIKQARLERAHLTEAHLEGADLQFARLAGATLTRAHLEGKKMSSDELESVRIRCKDFPALLSPADLRHAYFSQASSLDDITLYNAMYGGAKLVDVHWEGVNLAVVDWMSVKMLGDEREARQQQMITGEKESPSSHLNEYREAVRANRQLAIALQSQGLNEESARFAYRAQVLQRAVFRRQRKIGPYLFSLFLDWFAGYGYRPERCFLVYLVALIMFTVLHYLLGLAMGHPPTAFDAFAVSIQSLHGRIFSFQSGDPRTLLNTIEAFVGLFIEAIVVAVITQRILAK